MTYCRAKCSKLDDLDCGKGLSTSSTCSLFETMLDDAKETFNMWNLAPHMVNT